MNSNIHPIYGFFDYDVWKQVYSHRMNKKTNVRYSMLRLYKIEL